MERFLGLALGVFLLIGFTSPADAVIKLETATMQNGVAFIQGNGAVRGAQIFWEGWVVTTANKNNGGFSFFGVVPNDCVGALSDQPGGATPINVQVLDCTPVSAGVGMLATGQVTCYDIDGSIITCTGTGQAGDIQAGAALSYIDNGDGTITDNNTSLMWEKKSDDGSIHDQDNSYTCQDAFAYVATLNSGNFAGYNDWRLPNLRELQSIVNYQVVAPAVSAVFNTNCVPGATVLTGSCTAHVPTLEWQFNYWSSTTAVFQRGNAWYVNFNIGDPGHIDKPLSLRVRAVRGGS